VAAYASYGSELDTRPLLQAVLAGGKALILPRVNRAARRLDLYRVADLAGSLAPGPWGIPEPWPDACPPAAIGEADLVVVPGVVFDVAGGRIGHGAGYYDRLLRGLAAGSPPLVAGAFDLQVVPEVPMDAHDRRVDLVLTESHTYPK
jgi:5-formyltetrahydrofolate cyclo-ligase